MGIIRTNTFSFTARDIIRAAQDFDAARVRRRRLLFAATIGITAGIIACPVLIVQVFMPEHAAWVWGDFLVTLREQAWVLWLLGALVLASAVGKPLLWRYGVWRALRLNKEQFRDLQVTFSDEGVDFAWPHAALHNDWAFYDAVIESRRYFLLVYGGLYAVVPKAALTDEQIPLLAAMLRQHIPQYASRA